MWGLSSIVVEQVPATDQTRVRFPAKTYFLCFFIHLPFSRHHHSFSTFSFMSKYTSYTLKQLLHTSVRSTSLSRSMMVALLVSCSSPPRMYSSRMRYMR